MSEDEKKNEVGTSENENINYKINLICTYFDKSTLLTEKQVRNFLEEEKDYPLPVLIVICPYLSRTWIVESNSFLHIKKVSGLI